MALLRKRKENKEPQKDIVQEAEPVKVSPQVGGSAKFEAELTRLQAQMDSFREVRKIFGERFSRVNEMIGELRGMIIETNKDLQQIQVKTVKAVDLVEAVQPDKLMTETRKQEVKVEVLKANLESNEARMDTILKELKELRNQITVFRGVDDIVKLSGEVKKELIHIRTLKSTAERHSDKIESIYIDFQKRVRELNELEDTVKEHARDLNRLVKNLDEVKIKTIEKAEKKDVEKLITTSREFEDHTTRAISLLNRVFVDFEEGMVDKFDKKFERLQTLEGVLKELTQNNPNLEKNLQALEDLMREKVEAEEKLKQKAKKKGFVSWISSKVSKKPVEGESEEGASEDEVDIEAIGAEEEEL